VRGHRDRCRATACSALSPRARTTWIALSLALLVTLVAGFIAPGVPC
jgi:hypothetical protein